MSEYMLSKDYFVQVIRDLIVLAEDRKEYFTDLDSAIGDVTTESTFLSVSVKLIKILKTGRD